MAKKITSFSELIELWDTREALASDLGVKAFVVSKWWQRDSVPADWWSAILATDVAVKAGLKAETFVALAARKATELEEART